MVQKGIFWKTIAILTLLSIWLSVFTVVRFIHLHRVHARWSSNILDKYGSAVWREKRVIPIDYVTAKRIFFLEDWDLQ